MTVENPQAIRLVIDGVFDGESAIVGDRVAIPTRRAPRLRDATIALVDGMPRRIREVRPSAITAGMYVVHLEPLA